MPDRLYPASYANLTLKIPSVTPYTIGQLFYLFELATAFSGCLMNINPYDQPGVEHGKIATYSLMGREGYQDKKNEIETKARNVKKYILKIS